MARRIALASGNFLTAGTWGVLDTTMYNNVETVSTALTTAYQASSGYTTGIITIRGLLLKLSNRTGVTGTMSVHLAVAGVEVVGTLVTINVADLPAAVSADLNGGWIYFKFAGDVVLAAATSYTVEAKTSSGSQVSLFATSGTNWAVALQTTTTGAPAVGDDLVITGIHTTTGAPAAVTVTMDALASSITNYGAASTSLVTPSLAIGNSGSLTYGATAATNYYLRQSGNVIIYAGGTLNMGTVATAIPRDSSAILNFDCASNVNFGLTIRNLGTFIAQGLSRTVGKLIDRCKLNTDEAVNSTSLGVDTDTGWLSTDAIAVASTSQTKTESESGTLNGAAGASSLTVNGFAGVGGGVAFAHSGTSPTQAEVILLTRNVQIFGASATLQGYIDIKATATVDVDWTEFKWLGSATSLKRGITCAVTTGAVNIQFSSLHNFEVASSRGLDMSATSGTGLTFSNNVTFLIAAEHYRNIGTSGSQTLDNNIFMRNTGSFNLVHLLDIKITLTNSTLISGNSGLRLNETASIGTISGITIHSCGNGLVFADSGVGSLAPSGSLSDITIWRMVASGLILDTFNNALDVTITNLTVFGCTTASINFLGSMGNLILDNFVSNGDTTFASAEAILVNGTGVSVKIKILSSDLSSVSGIKTAHTTDILLGVVCLAQINLNNTKMGAATEVGNQNLMSTAGYISSQKHDQTAGNHKTWKKYGTLDLETTIVHAGGQSLRMLPNNASSKLESGSFFVAVKNGQTITPSVWVQESATYNGNRCRLIVKRNDAIGITADAVLDTRTGASDAVFEQMTGTTAAATDDGVMEFVVDCDGTAGTGYVYVDSFSVEG